MKGAVDLLRLGSVGIGERGGSGRLLLVDAPASPDAGLVEPFKRLSLRLELNEVGVVKTDFGIHIIQRTE